MVEVAQRLMAPSYTGSGALTVAQAVDPVEVLRALHGSALEVFGEVLVG
ncbi:hypothetical protein LJR129_000229 [Acidovorax sp. LjRoot129]